MSGKGDTPRPFSVDSKTYADSWERTFGFKVCEICKGEGFISDQVIINDSTGTKPSTFKRACLSCQGEGKVKI